MKVGDKVRDLGKVCPEFTGLATIVEELGEGTFRVMASDGHQRGRYASEIELVEPKYDVGTVGWLIEELKRFDPHIVVQDSFGFRSEKVSEFTLYSGQKVVWIE